MHYFSVTYQTKSRMFRGFITLSRWYLSFLRWSIYCYGCLSHWIAMMLLVLNIENKLLCGKTKRTSTSKWCYTGRQNLKINMHIFTPFFVRVCVCVCEGGGGYMCVCVCFGYACLMQIWSVFLNWFLHSYSVAASFIDSTSGIFIPEGTKLTKMTYGISYFTWLIF